MGKKKKRKEWDKAAYARAHPAWATKRRMFGWQCLGVANHLKYSMGPAKPDNSCGDVLSGDEFKVLKAANKSLVVTEKLYRKLAKLLLRGEGIYTD